MREKFIMFLVKLLMLPRSNFKWWEDIRNGDRKLEITLHEYDLVTMTQLKVMMIESRIRELQQLLMD